MLELPVNLHQLTKEKQCTYIKKAHKTLARKWHPDKARGNKARCVGVGVGVCARTLRASIAVSSKPSEKVVCDFIFI